MKNINSIFEWDKFENFTEVKNWYLSFFQKEIRFEGVLSAG